MIGGVIHLVHRYLSCTSAHVLLLQSGMNPHARPRSPHASIASNCTFWNEQGGEAPVRCPAPPPASLAGPVLLSSGGSGVPDMTCGPLRKAVLAITDGPEDAPGVPNKRPWEMAALRTRTGRRLPGPGQLMRHRAPWARVRAQLPKTHSVTPNPSCPIGGSALLSSACAGAWVCQ